MRATCPDAKPQRGEGKDLGSILAESWDKLASSQGQVQDSKTLSREREKRERGQGRKFLWDSGELLSSL